MGTFTVGVNYCWRGRSIGKYEGTAAVVSGTRDIIYSRFRHPDGHDELINPFNTKEVTPCPLKGGKTRRRHHRKQRKTRRH